MESRVIRAAEAALAEHQYVSAIDVFTRMGLLATRHVEDWRRGASRFSNRLFRGNLKKISHSMTIFQTWAQSLGLKPSETGYLRRTRGGVIELQFSRSGEARTSEAQRFIYFHKQKTPRRKLHAAFRALGIAKVRNTGRSDGWLRLDSVFCRLRSVRPSIGSACDKPFRSSDRRFGVSSRRRCGFDAARSAAQSSAGRGRPVQPDPQAL
jgi:hypothetical protein